jgi:hypothetical protein
MSKRAFAVVAVLASALQVGCLTKETIHTLYVTPDGAVAWGVIEKDVRSDDSDIDRRQAEEQKFADAARSGSHDVAVAFERLGPAGLTTTVVRDMPPFLVYTEARFERMDDLTMAILERLGICGESVIDTDGDVTTWRLVAHVDPVSLEQMDEDVLPLLDDAGRYRIIAVGCEFADAQGFRIEEGGRQAIPLKISEEEIERSGGTLVRSLSWRRSE